MQLSDTPEPRRPSTAPSPMPDTAAIADRVGVAGSLLCAVHCALLPFLISLLPALGIGFSGTVDFDQGFVVFATLLGIATLSIGYRRHRAHHAWLPLVPGLALVWTGSFTSLHDHSLAHALMMTLGGLLIAAAHLINLRLSHRAAGASIDASPSAEPA